MTAPCRAPTVTFLLRVHTPRLVHRCALAAAALVASLLAWPPAAALAGQSVHPEPAGRPAVTYTLDDVVRAALAQHPLVEAARARADAARFERAAVGTLPNPVGTVWIENIGMNGLAAPGSGRETSTYLTWPIEALLQRPARVRAADGALQTAEASLAVARRLVATEAVRAFFDVALAQEAAIEAEHERELLEQLAAYNRARAEEGVTAEIELLRTQVELDRAATDAVFADVELARRIAALRPYLGAVIAHADAASLGVSVTAEPQSPGASVPPLPMLLARALDGRPEMAAARARVAAATATVGLERQLVFGQLGATVGHKRVDGHDSLLAGVGVTLPLFTRNRSGVARATSERLALEHDLAWTERTIVADVHAAHGATSRLARQLAGLQGSLVARAEDVHRLTLAAYQEGGAALLQVLDTTRVVADARLTYARALFAERQSRFELALAAGAEPIDALAQVHAWSVAPAATPQGDAK
jgi:outer membrane protein, heavy metal efflux system